MIQISYWGSDGLNIQNWFAPCRELRRRVPGGPALARFGNPREKGLGLGLGNPDLPRQLSTWPALKVKKFPLCQSVALGIHFSLILPIKRVFFEIKSENKKKSNSNLCVAKKKIEVLWLQKHGTLELNIKKDVPTKLVPRTQNTEY